MARTEALNDVKYIYVRRKGNISFKNDINKIDMKQNMGGN